METVWRTLSSSAALRRRLAIRSEGKAYNETSTAARRALELNASAVRLHELSHDGEADSGATSLAACTATEEPFEDLMVLVCGHSRPGIGDLEAGGEIGGPYDKGHAASRRRELDGIGEQIHRHLAYPMRIGPDDGGVQRPFQSDGCHPGNDLRAIQLPRPPPSQGRSDEDRGSDRQLPPRRASGGLPPCARDEASPRGARREPRLSAHGRPRRGSRSRPGEWRVGFSARGPRPPPWCDAIVRFARGSPP